MASVNRPEIFLLSLEYKEFLDKSYSSLMSKLYESAQVKRATVASDAIQYLEKSNPRAILVTDEGLTETGNRAVLDKVVAYIRNGGLVIIGLHFPTFIHVDAFENFFRDAFGLPWKAGDYHRTDFEFNPSCALPATANSLPGPFSMKVVHVRDAQPHEKIFVPVRDATIQSAVFPPADVDRAQAAVAGAKVGKGYLVYCGDVNPGEASDRVILSLCGL